ncbi:hypothetical protein BJX70DRAFT_200347 [Aspergillus crustosus]
MALDSPFDFDADALAQRAIERLRRELDDSRQRIDRDTEVINNLHEKVTELEELVKKQKVTISTQSRTISDRRILRKHQQQSQSQSPLSMGMGVFPTTASHHHHHLHQCQYQCPGSGSGTSGVSCCGGGTCGGAGNGACVVQNTSSPLDNQPQYQSQIQTPTPQSVTSIGSASQYSNLYDQPPPKFEIPFSGPLTPFVTGVPPGLAPSLFGPLAAAFANSSSPEPAADYHKEMADFSTRFLALMRMSEIFGQTHASHPNIFTDSHLEDHVKDYLMAISSRSQASVLVGNAATRGFFVAKAINWYLIDKILKISVIKGFDASVDLEIGQIQKQMTPDTPITVRHLMLAAMTTHLITLSKKSNFPEFNQQRIQSHLTKLWTYIGPLGHDPSNQAGQMWLDLGSIVTEAHALAIDMYSMPLEYRIEFPGQGEHFDPSTMINRDPYVHSDPQSLKNGETRVRLGITPIVRIRNNSQSPGEVNLMYLGHVLLNVPRKQAP